MKLDVLSNEELISIIREFVPDLREEELVYQVLKRKTDALYTESQHAYERKNKAEAWFELFLKSYKYRETKPGTKEYFIPQADLNKHEVQIKELNEARTGYWKAHEAHWESYQKSWDAWKDVYMPEAESAVAKFEEILLGRKIEE